MSGHAEALPYSIGVESESRRISLGDLTHACAAVQQQLTRDVAPAWHVSATVHAFPAGQVPLGYWKVTVRDDIGEPGAAGFHDDAHRQPYALVEASDDWTVTLSHEIVEMVVDPFGSRQWVALSPEGNGERVRVLVEACDPPEARSYEIDGVAVSDFAYPALYRNHRAARRRLAHLDPELMLLPGSGLALAEGGYVSWEHADGSWSQATWFSGSQPSVRRLGRLDTRGGALSPRSVIDRLTREFRA